MLQLPKDIDEKIQKLPVIGFGDSEAFQQILFSDDFTDIFNYYKVNYLPDVLKTKPEITRHLVINKTIYRMFLKPSQKSNKKLVYIYLLQIKMNHLSSKQIRFYTNDPYLIFKVF